MATQWNPWLIDQLDRHWSHQLRPRLTGLTDDEYFWEPVPGSWNVHPRGQGTTEIQGGSGEVTIDFAFPEPQPVPLTTIAWRLGHLIVGVLGARVHAHFGGPEADYLTFEYAATAAEALRQLDEGYAAWTHGVRGWGHDAILQPCGASEGPWAEHARAELVLHINREVIHHGAEISLLRDLHQHRFS